MKADPLAVVRDREVPDTVRRVVREPRGLTVVEVDRPEARDRRLRIAHADVETLVEPRALVLVDRIRRDEVNPARIGRQLPEADSRWVVRELRWLERIAARDRRRRQRVQLLVIRFARAIDEPLPVFRE